MKTFIQKLKSNLVFLITGMFLLVCYGFSFSQADNLYLDNSFGVQGKVILPDDMSYLKKIEFDEHGNIFAAGFSTDNSNKHLKILKITENGIIDENFANNTNVEIEVDLSCEIQHMHIKSDNSIFIVTSNIINSIIKIKSFSFNQNGNLEQEINCDPSFEFGLDTFNLNAACFKDDYFFIPDERYVYKLNYLGELFINFGENGKIDVKEDYDLYIKKVLEVDELNELVVAGIIKETCNYGPTANTFVSQFFKNGTPILLAPWTIDVNIEGNLTMPGEHETVITMFNIPDYQYVVVAGPTVINAVRNTFMMKFLQSLLLDVYNGRGEFRNFIAMDLPVAIYENSFFIGGKNGEIANFDLNLLLNEGFANEGVFTLPDDIRYLDIKVQGSDKLLMAGYDNTSDTKKAVLARFAIGTNSSSNIENISNSISIYPNPATDILHFNQAQTYEIFDIQGRVLKKSEAEQNSANISELKNGMYFIKIENKLFKFIKN